MISNQYLLIEFQLFIRLILSFTQAVQQFLLNEISLSSTICAFSGNDCISFKYECKLSHFELELPELLQLWEGQPSKKKLLIFFGFHFWTTWSIQFFHENFKNNQISTIWDCTAAGAMQWKFAVSWLPNQCSVEKSEVFFKSSWKTEWSRLFSNEIQKKVVSGHITGVGKWWWHCCFSNLLATSRVLRRQNSSFVDISPTMMPIWSSVWCTQYTPLTSLCAWNWHLLPNVGII